MNNPTTNYCRAILGENPSAKKSIRLVPKLLLCSDKLLELIYTYSKAVDLKPGETLIEEGLYDQWVYFMVFGELDIYINNSKLGSTPGPLVGERCIVGEPRGATLIAGEEGVMALGIEMSLMDEIAREINNYLQTEEDESKIAAFKNEKHRLTLEMLAIVLNEVIIRIVDLNQTSLFVLLHLKSSENGKDIHKQESLHIDADHEQFEEEVISTSLQQNVFKVFSKKLYRSIVLDDPLHPNLGKIREKEWFSLLKWDGESTRALLMNAFDEIASSYQVPYEDLVEVAIKMFEVASKHTASLNRSLNSMLDQFECEQEKQKALDTGQSIAIDVTITKSKIDILRNKLFDPIEQALASQSNAPVESIASKLSQSDIDALFD